jgi:hypothetical protein
MLGKIARNGKTALHPVTLKELGYELVREEVVGGKPYYIFEVTGWATKVPQTREDILEMVKAKTVIGYSDAGDGNTGRYSTMPRHLDRLMPGMSCLVMSKYTDPNLKKAPTPTEIQESIQELKKLLAQ